jgi:hypothetical protein
MDNLIDSDDLIDWDQRSLAGRHTPPPAIYLDTNSSAFPVAAAAIAFNPIFWK